MTCVIRGVQLYQEKTHDESNTVRLAICDVTGFGVMSVITYVQIQLHKQLLKGTV